MPGMTTPTLLTEALRREGVADARTDALTIGMYATDAGIYRVPPRAVAVSYTHLTLPTTPYV